jgi:hypothetical protein
MEPEPAVRIGNVVPDHLDMGHVEMHRNMIFRE